MTHMMTELGYLGRWPWTKIELHVAFFWSILSTMLSGDTPRTASRSASATVFFFFASMPIFEKEQSVGGACGDWSWESGS